MKGGVYFVSGAGLTKIGISGDIEARVAGLRRMCPIPIVLEHRIPGANSGDERYLHMLFSDHRRHGEWFALPPGWRNKVDEWWEEKARAAREADERRRQARENASASPRRVKPDQAGRILLTADEAAKRLGLDPQRLLDLARFRLVPHWMIGQRAQRPRFAAVDVERWANEPTSLPTIPEPT